MKIIVAGASGMIGSAVVPYLASQGHEVVRLVRREPGAVEVSWDPDAGSIDAASLEGADGVVNLASMPGRCGGHARPSSRSAPTGWQPTASWLTH